MLNLIYLRGFDSVISAGMVVKGTITIPKNQILLIEGSVTGEFVVSEHLHDASWLHISGDVNITGDIVVSNLHITGTVKCQNLICTGILSFSKTANLQASNITYNVINLEPGAVVIGNLTHEVQQ